MAFASKTAEKATTNAAKANVPVLQPKLTVNEPNDSYEQEANEVAERVMRTRTPSVQEQT